MANCSTLFRPPTCDYISWPNGFYNDMCAPGKYFSMEGGDRPVLGEGKGGHVLREIYPVKRAKTAEIAHKESSFDDFTGRVTRSRAASLKTEWNKNLSVSPNKDGRRRTGLRSAARKLQHSNELSVSGTSPNPVEDGTREAVGIQMDSQPVLSVSAENQTVDKSDNIVGPQPSIAETLADDVSGAAYLVRNDAKMASAGASRVRRITSLVEAKHLLFDDIEDCTLRNNSFTILEKKNQRITADIALVKLDAVQRSNKSVCGDSNSDKPHDPSASRQLQKEDAINIAETMCSTGDFDRALEAGPEEENLEEPEVVDSNCDSHPRSCNREPSQIPDFSLSKVTCHMSEKVPIPPSLARSSFVGDCMLSYNVNASIDPSKLHEANRRSSSGSIVERVLEEVEPCSKKHGKMSRSTAPSKQAEFSSSVEPKSLSAGIEEYGLHENNNPENALSQLESVQLVVEKSVFRDVKKSDNCSVNVKLQEDSLLHATEVTRSIDKIDRISDDLLETEDLKCDSAPKQCNVKTSSVSAKTLSNRSVPSYSSLTAECMLNSVVDLSGQLNDFQVGGKMSSLESPVWYLQGENCCQKLIKETSGCPIQLINAVHNDSSGSVLCCSEVLRETEEAETAQREVTVTVDAVTVNPDFLNAPNAMLEDGHVSWSSGANVTSSCSHSKTKPGKDFKPKEAVDYANSLKKHATVKLDAITLTPDPLKALSAIVEVGHISWRSDANVANSIPHSPVKVEKVLAPRETVDNPNSVQMHAIRQTPNATDIQKALPQTRYSFRSSASFDKKLGSQKKSGSVLHSSEKCIFPEAYTSEISEGHLNVAEKYISPNRVTSNSREIQTARPKAQMPSHDQDCAFSNSNGTNSEHIFGQTVLTIDHACEVTCPKRRKIEGQSNNVLSTSPRLRLKPLVCFQKSSDSMYSNSSKNTSGALIECERLLSSEEVETKILGTFSVSCFEELHQTKKQCTTMDDSNLKAKDQTEMTPLPIISRHEMLLLDLADGDLDISLRDKGVVGSIALNLEKNHDPVDGYLHAGKTLEHESTKQGRFGEEFTERGKYDEESSLSTHDSARSSMYGGNLDSYTKTIPEFEGFSSGVPTIMEDGIILNGSDISSLTKERVSLLDKLCRSNSVPNPVIRSSSKCDNNKASDVYQPLPAGLLEHMITSTYLPFDDVSMEQFKTAEDGNAAIPYCNLRQESDVSLLGRSHSCSMPSTSKYDCEARKPPLTPIPLEKLRQRTFTRRSSASSKELGSNPELICFRIDENSSSTVENMPVDELNSIPEGRVDSTGMKNLTNRKSLDGSQAYQNAPSLVSVCEKHLDRDSLDSVNTESYFGIQIDVNSSSGNDYTGSGKMETDNKKKCSPSVSENRVRKDAESFCNISKPEIARKANQRDCSRAVQKGFKSNNIVSSIQSFIPLIKQRQQAAAQVTGKRDVKVKALEAAEAAKRLGEKKQNEREMRKAAAKLERVRLEEENIRQLYLKQKETEEARKKKEAEFAARKRQREEDRKDKERKRRCTEDVRKHQRERLHAQREKKVLQCNAAHMWQLPQDEKKQRRKERAKKTMSQLKSERVRDASGWCKLTESESTISTVAVHARVESSSLEARDASKKSTGIEKVVNNSIGPLTTIQDRLSITKESQALLSYDMTPYRDSDDEDGEEDIRRRRKFIPLWARKECLNQILCSNCHIDPTEIFSRKSSFSLSEVLSPPMRMRPLSQVQS